jgi:hypothetical protein
VSQLVAEVADDRRLSEIAEDLEIELNELVGLVEEIAFLVTREVLLRNK